MSSSHGDKRSSDVETGLRYRPSLLSRETSSSPSRERIGSVIPDASALPAGSSTTPILIGDKERATDSMPPPPARKEIVLALRAPSVVPVAQPKGRKRKFAKGGDGESSQQGDSSIASGLRGKFMSLIDGMIRELERDLGKTASSLLKEKKARKAESLEVRRLQRQIEGDAGLPSRGIREAKDALRSEFQARLTKISAFLGSLECIRNRDLALATIEGGMAVGDLAVVDGDFDLILADLKSACFFPTCSEGLEGKDPVLGEGGGDAPPGLDEATDALALPAGSSTTPILVEDKERAADSMPPPPARKEIVLALRAPSVVPVAQPKGRKRKFTKGGDGESSQQEDSSIASGLRGKCGSETSRLTGELLELQGRRSETEAILTAVKDSHSVKVSKLEVTIGELERDLGKTASSLLKEKKDRKAKSSEVRRLQRQIEGDAGLASCGIREAKDALRSEFQARLAKISAFLGSLECIRNMDLALATIEGGMAVVQSFQSEIPPTLEAEEARLSGCKGDLAVVDGDIDLILADLKSACFLPTFSEVPEGKDPVLGEGGGDAAPGLDETTGEEGM
ncbi:hypothetical protein F2Q68_00045823 [Brassica cretica]|uniref:Uncharacterized protein n=1 Tax=Brassica cretica TaxID=69181 RepID=A0A8S9LFG5_BRACR|nr:hypothetical protein F2Q68_00045823 [Brassica cretica]